MQLSELAQIEFTDQQTFDRINQVLIWIDSTPEGHQAFEDAYSLHRNASISTICK